MNDPLHIALIIGSTRQARLGPKVAQWLHGVASQRPDLKVELLDLKDFDLPLFDEKASNLWLPSEDARATAWQEKIGEFDGYLVTVGEYNHSMTGALKNAFDQAYVEWGRKPIGFAGYGGVGGARAVEHARSVAVELQMVPVRTAVHIAGGDFYALYQGAKTMPEIEANLLPAAHAMLDAMAWWGQATRAARKRDADEAIAAAAA
ncbi:MAG: NAD(P)H-dependent oxidoreductase [Burkholderiaceae bacterium]|nr:NAD(P)H-dependent oxidoreductase [Burkholderiaceae bacterium]